MLSKNDIEKSPSVFIIPYYSENSKSKEFLQETLDGLYKQTDNNWQAVIVDDASKIDEQNYLLKLEEKLSKKIKVFLLKNNCGQGVCRNIGIIWACKIGAPIVLFNDADDISHPQRLEVVKETFLSNDDIGLVYSTFNIIDELSQHVLSEQLSPSILEILTSHQSNQVEGKDAWIRIGTETGYTNKTSSTSVLTKYAYRCPFPAERASEDSHTWMRLSANGASFKYISNIPTLYRIPTYTMGQASRTRLGPKVFNEIKARVDSDGFLKAIEIAVSKGSIKQENIPALISKFYNRLAITMMKEEENALVKKLLEKADYYAKIDLIYAGL
ncbi:MAG: glycosyltransferase family A protein [Candidatus Thiodiazotropha sp.]